MNHLIPIFKNEVSDEGRCFMREELFSFDELVKVDEGYIHFEEIEKYLNLFEGEEREYKRTEINRINNIAA